MPEMPYEDVEIEGHLIDSLMMPHIMDEVMDLDGEFEMLTFEVGRMKDDPSHAVMRIYGRDAAHLDEIMTAIKSGASGKVADIEDGESGEHVEIWVE